MSGFLSKSFSSFDFEFEDDNNDDPKPESERMRKPPMRSRSQDDVFFSDLAADQPSRGLLLPSSANKNTKKTGRVVPRPSRAPPRNSPAVLPQNKLPPQQPVRGRSPAPNRVDGSSADFERRAPGKSQSANLEYMRNGNSNDGNNNGINGSSANNELGKRRPPLRSISRPRERENSLSPPQTPEQKKPSSLKKLLGRTSSSKDLGKSLHSALPPSTPRSSRQLLQTASSHTPKRQSSFKKLLVSPMRKAPGRSKSDDLDLMKTSSHDATIGDDKPLLKKQSSFKKLQAMSPLRKPPLRSKSDDLDFMKTSGMHSDPPLVQNGDSKSKNIATGGISSRVRSKKKKSLEEENGSSEHHKEHKKDKPKSFKQLLKKKGKSISGHEKSTSTTAIKKKIHEPHDESPPPSPRPLPPPVPQKDDREPSLSPEVVKKPTSLLTNFLDYLHDSYIDPKDDYDDDDEGSMEEVYGLNESMSRFDQSFTKLANWAGG